jgi:hypothetical protein
MMKMFRTLASTQPFWSGAARRHPGYFSKSTLHGLPSSLDWLRLSLVLDNTVAFGPICGRLLHWLVLPSSERASFYACGTLA